MHVELLAPGAGIEAGTDERGLGGVARAGQARERRAQGLAALRKGRVDDRERAQPVGVVAERLVVATPRDQLGMGQNTLRPTLPAAVVVPCQAALTLGTP